MQNLIKKNILIVTFLIFSTTFAFNDAPEPWQFGFQDPATPIMEGIINFHNHIMFFLTVIESKNFWLQKWPRCSTSHPYGLDPVLDPVFLENSNFPNF